MTVARNVRESSDAVPPDVGGYNSWAWGTPLDGVARRAMRVPWLWPALLTLGLGCYQLDRPELWRDELWSWSFAADPVRELVTSAKRSNPAELGYDLVLHYWMAAFGDSVLAMRMLSVHHEAVCPDRPGGRPPGGQHARGADHWRLARLYDGHL